MAKLAPDIKKAINKLTEIGVDKTHIDAFIADVSSGRLVAVNQQNQEDLKLIGTRMLEARGIAGFSQIAAAKKLGYANSSRLNKIERAIDVKSVSISLIKKAAKVYSVSADFILGLSNDWERNAKANQERDISNYLMETWAKSHIHDANAILYLQNKIDSICRVTALYEDSVADCRRALVRFMQLNPGFDDMRGGASVVGSVERSEHAIYTAKGNLKRFHADCKDRGFNHQLSVFDFD